MNDQGNSSGSPIPPNGWGNQGATPQQGPFTSEDVPRCFWRCRSCLCAGIGRLFLYSPHFFYGVGGQWLWDEHHGKRGRHNACRSGFPEMPSFGS